MNPKIGDIVEFKDKRRTTGVGRISHLYIRKGKVVEFFTEHCEDLIKPEQIVRVIEETKIPMPLLPEPKFKIGQHIKIENGPNHWVYDTIKDIMWCLSHYDPGVIKTEVMYEITEQKEFNAEVEEEDIYLAEELYENRIPTV